MKSTSKFFLGAICGAALSTALVQASQPAEFDITITNSGKIDLVCHGSCAWQKLSWTCNKFDLSKACTVPIDEYGMSDGVEEVDHPIAQ